MGEVYKYIRMEEHSVPQRKTRLFTVLNNSSDDAIGYIEWYGAWRQYCFFPCGYIVFSAGCLDDISDFIGSLMTERRNK
jgi:hypothetical protein